LKVVIAGAGIAGSILAYALHHTSGVDVQCLERSGRADQSDADTGLNIGPNAIKALAAHVPDLHAAVLGVSVLWRRWRVSLTDGTLLMDLALERVAENPGIRLRWAELYRVLRTAAAPRIRFGTTLVSAGHSARRPGKLFIEARRGEERVACEDADLLVGSDGRYSEVRKKLCGLPSLRHVGVAMFRLLIPDSSGGLIDDYEQWFNGPNRLLAFRVPDGAVYIAGSFPIAEGGPIPEEAKSAEALRALYTPRAHRPSRACQWMIDALCARLAQIHWARLQEVAPLYSDPSGRVLLLGDAAHDMVPTLGQGATQAIEDACLAAAQIRAHWLGARRAKVPVDVPKLVRAIAERRAERIRFVMDFSLEATDTMLAGADPVIGTLKKLERPFQEKLRRLYCDAPVVI
jgi:salicylate hydroxylase